jgi:ABC-type glycerol-3-phosphate transport system substrate-binding protein
MKKLVAAAVIVLSVLAGVFGCGDVIEKVDGTAVRVYVYNGGYGHAWAKELADSFNLTQTEYKIQIIPLKDSEDRVRADITSGISGACDMYIIDASLDALMAGGFLEDISDIWNTDVDGNGVTVEEKMRDSETFKKFYTNNGKQYGLPLGEGMSGLIYDHEVFLENNWLYGPSGQFITNGNKTLSVGRDGVAGTYDDGQPITEPQFEAMVNRISATGAAPIMYSGQAKYHYPTRLYDAIYAAYDGVDNYMTSWTFDGEYTFGNDTQPTPITLQNGYKTFEMTGRLKALEFNQKYFNNSKYGHRSCFELGASAMDVQSSFILSYLKEPSERGMMMIEGEWWENEARTVFGSLAKDDPAYAYGKRDYRFMLLPTYEGSAEQDGHMIPILAIQSIFIRSAADEDKKAIAKEFMKYIQTIDAMRTYTVHTGCGRPYQYDIPEAMQSKMTRFGKTVWSIYNDPKNTIIRPKTDYWSSDVYRKALLLPYMTTEGQYEPVVGLQFFDPSHTGNLSFAQKYYQGGIDYYVENWDKILTTLGA